MTNPNEQQLLRQIETQAQTIGRKNKQIQDNQRFIEKLQGFIGFQKRVILELEHKAPTATERAKENAEQFFKR